MLLVDLQAALCNDGILQGTLSITAVKSVTCLEILRPVINVLMIIHHL